MKKILILTNDTGFGHRSAANAIAESLQSSEKASDITVIIKNIMDDPTIPAVLRNSQSDYDRIVREIPIVYEVSYVSTNTPFVATLGNSFFSVVLYNSLKKEINQHSPDIIVNTFTNYHGPAQRWYSQHEKMTFGKSIENSFFYAKKNVPNHIPFVSVITDMGEVHSMWYSPVPDLYCVANEYVKQDAIRHGVVPERIEITGIPVKSQYVTETRSQRDLRDALGWEKDKLTILAIGSKRVRSLFEYIQVIDQTDYDLQIITVAGGDETLYKKLANVQWRHPAKTYKYVTNMPELMMASDLTLTKPGGLITSESLAAGKPIAMINMVNGQEVGNARLVSERNAGGVINEAQDLLDMLQNCFHDPAYLPRISENAKRIGVPNSSHLISKKILTLLYGK